jgi:hypothetical protein
MRPQRETQVWWKENSLRDPGIKTQSPGSSTARQIARLVPALWLAHGDSRLFVLIDIPTNICRGSQIPSHSLMWTMSLPSLRNVNFPCDL